MDERIWTDRPLEPGETLTLDDCRVTRGTVPFLCMISGDLVAATGQLRPNAPMLGLAEAPDGPDYAISIARDQAALITAIEPSLPDGWHKEGFALNRACDRFSVLTLQGPSAAELLAHGLPSSLPEHAPSAAIRFAGLDVLLTGQSNGYRLWVEQSHLTYITTFLKCISRT